MPIVLMGIMVAAAIAIGESLITLPMNGLEVVSGLPPLLLWLGLGTTLAWVLGGD
jgi:uncharacterized membrane protein